VKPSPAGRGARSTKDQHKAPLRFITLSDGLERTISREGADVAPESPDGLEDQENQAAK
jgi:hypothetical protein